jgi:hypothetical protein
MLTIPLGFGTVNPNDSTAYNAGMIAGSVLTTTYANASFSSPKDGVIRSIHFNISSATTVGTAENWTIELRVNDTTNYTVATVATTDTLRKWVNNNLNIPIKTTDTMTIRTTTPAWVTNPEGCRGGGFILVECE